MSNLAHRPEPDPGSAGDASAELLERVATRLRAMGNPLRLRILHTLEGRELTVSEILAEVGGRQANLSKHLSVLRGAGLLNSRRDGVSVLYRIRDEAVFDICSRVCDSLLQEASADVARIARARELMQGKRR